MREALRRRIPESYKGVYEIWRSYIVQYGGASKIIKSPYLHCSIVFTLITFGIWSDSGWWDLPIAILPSLISFTLAGYALFLALGSDTFRQLMAGEENSISPLLEISATFVHFIVVQTISLLLALLAEAHPVSQTVTLLQITWLNVGCGQSVRIALCYGFWFVSFATFIYSIFCILAITMSLFRVARWLNTHHLIQASVQAAKDKQAQQEK